MKHILKINFFKFILSFIFPIILYFIDFRIIESIIKNQNISYFLITLIAGLFGFIIAIIPFTIQILSIDKDSDFIQELKKSNLIKSLFKRLIDLLKNMFKLFIYLLFLEVLVRDTEIMNKYLYLFLLIFQVYLSYGFLYVLKNIVFYDIESLVNIYFKTLKN